MRHKHYMQVPIDIVGKDVVLDVSYVFSPGRPAVMYLKNGDPGYPEEPAEVEIQSITVGPDPLPVWLDDLIAEHVYEWIVDHHEEPEREYQREYD